MSIDLRWADTGCYGLTYECRYSHTHEAVLKEGEITKESLVALATQILACTRAFKEKKAVVDEKFEAKKIKQADHKELCELFDREINADQKLFDFIKSVIPFMKNAAFSEKVDEKPSPSDVKENS